MARENVIVFVEDRESVPEEDLKLEGIELKDGTRISIEVTDVGETTIGLKLMLLDAHEDDEDAEYEFEVRIDPKVILDGRKVDMMSFLDSMTADLDRFLECFFANVIANEARISITNAGFDAIVNLSLRGYEEELRIPRDEAEVYFLFIGE
ncbi:MAG: hypothetical protein QG626_505 [Patescibacteria group bacterium]|jgi:hypothetical protein|nr:hypothetical protein [Patescibacteria group bacterium]